MKKRFIMIIQFSIFSWPSFAESFKSDVCGFNVIFPSKPTYQTMYTPNTGKFTQAQLKAGKGESGYILRAECIPIIKTQYKIMASEKYMLQRAVSYASSNGIQNAEYKYKQLNIGHKVTLRGFKTIGNTPATYEVQMYLGKSSFLSLYAASASKVYPASGIVTFFKSVSKK